MLSNFSCSLRSHYIFHCFSPRRWMRQLNLWHSYNVKTYVETISVLESYEWTYSPTSLQALVLDILYSPRLSHLLQRWNIFKLLFGFVLHKPRFSFYKPRKVLQAPPFLFRLIWGLTIFSPYLELKTPEISLTLLLGY